MNRIYRIVFNRALGIWQVASELVKRLGGLARGDGGAVTGTVPTLRFAMWCALGFVSLAATLDSSPVYAQDAGRILVDRTAPGNQRPSVTDSPSGAPVVNITTPSAAGVSRNAYSQFDVGTQGAILNNSRKGADTQLGGQIVGNPNLITGTARVILNEVNGPASQLNGYVEVAGDRAQVIIANPAGIQVNGGGFINADRATLTTGTAIVNGGALEGYRVEGGAIRIQGEGLNSRSQDYTDLIARSVEANAGVWANQLQVTTGANTVSADHTQITATGTTTVSPGYALDVSALGGMYANKIQLLGTEHGVGVRNAGTIGAQAGELIVTADGRLENTGKLQAQTNTRIDATGGVANAGLISAGREAVIHTDADVDNSGGTLNAQRIEVNAAALANRGGTIEQTGLQGMALNAQTISNRDGGRIGLAEPASGGGEGGGSSDGGSAGGENGGNSSGSTGGDSGGEVVVLPTPEPLSDGALNIAGALNNDGGKINAGGGVQVNSATGIDNSGGHLGVRELAITQGDLFNDGGELTVTGDARVHAGRIGNDAGRLEVGGALDLDAQTISNRAGTISHSATGDARVHAGTFDNTDGTLATNANALDASGEVIVNERGRIEHAGTGGLNLQAGTLKAADGTIVTNGAANLTLGQADHRGATLSATQLTVNASNFDNRAGNLVATGTGANTLTVTGSLDNGEEGTIYSGGDLSITAGTFGNAAGTVQHAGAGTLAIDAKTLEGGGGTLASNGALTLKGETTNLREGTTQAQRIAIDTGTLTTADGTLIAAGTDALTISARSNHDNTAGTLATNGIVQLNAGSLTNTDGTINAAGTGASAVTVGSALDNTRGTLATAGALGVQAGTLINRDTAATETTPTKGITAQALTLQASILDNDHGQIGAGTAANVKAGLLTNTDGAITAGDALDVSARLLQGQRGTLGTNGALTLSGSTVNLRDGTTFGQSVQIETDRLTTAGGALRATGTDALKITARNSLDNTAGTIATNGALDVTVGTASVDTCDSDIQMAGNGCGTLTNAGGTINAAGTGPSKITVNGALDNTGGLIAGSGSTTITAASLVNRDTRSSDPNAPAKGIWSNQLTVDARKLDNANGQLGANGTATLTARVLDNTRGSITAANALNISATTLNGEGGTLGTNGTLTLTGETMNLRGGTTSAQTIVVDTGDLTTADGAMVASGTDALQLNVRRHLDNSAGTIATNGAMQLSAGSANNTDGAIQAAGTGATDLRVAGAFDNTRGTIATAGATTLATGDLINTGGLVQAASDATLTLDANGRLDNTDGTVVANGAIDVSAQSLTNAGGVVQTVQGITANVVDTLDNSGGLMVAGGDLTATAGMVLNRDTSVPGATEPTGMFGQRVTLAADTLDNSRGQIVANDALTLRGKTQAGTALTNAGGVLDGVGTTSVAATSFDNTGGQLVQRGTDGSLALDVDGALINANGLIGAEGVGVIRAGSIDNGTGTMFGQQNLTLTSAGDLRNAQGVVQSGGDLTVNAAGTLDNTDGAIDATGRAALIAAHVENVRGQVLAGSATDVPALTVAATSLNNQAGVVGTREGDAVLNVADIDNRSGGRLVADRDQTLNSDAVDNSGGIAFAGRNLSYENAGGRLTNADGQFGAGENARLTLANVSNTEGGKIQAGAVWLNTPNLDLRGNGEVVGNEVHAQLATLTGDGRVYGTQWLDTDFRGDYTYGTGPRLESDVLLDIAVAGTFTNVGTLQTPGELALSATSVINQGAINASNAEGGGYAHITAGSIENKRGASFEGDWLELNANVVTNTGDVIGDNVTITADTFTNGQDLGAALAAVNYGEGFIGAAQYLDIRANRLANLDGDIFSGGGLSIAGRDAARAQQLRNISGRIQAEGNATIAADEINNARRMLAVETYSLSADEAYALSTQKKFDEAYAALSATDRADYDRIVAKSNIKGSNLTAAEKVRLAELLQQLGWVRVDSLTPEMYVTADAELNRIAITEYGAGSSWMIENPSALVRQNDTYTTGQRLNDAQTSAESQIIAGGDLTLDSGGVVRNYASRIAAGGNLTIAGAAFDPDSPDPRVENIALAGQYTGNRATTAWIFVPPVKTKYTDGRGTHETIAEFAATMNEDLVATGPNVADASITAGKGVFIDAGDVTNAAVTAGTGLNAQSGGDLNGAATTNLGTANGAAAGAAGSVDAANSQQVNGHASAGSAQGGSAGPQIGPSGAAPQVIGTADRPLPNLVAADNGMFDLNADPNAKFLVTTAPRFAKGGPWESSDYLLNALRTDPNNIHKRLGDGYYEQRLVMEQIFQLTGRRSLNGDGDAMAQYRNLMDNAAAAADRLGLQLGAPLTSAQIESLDSDIVWLVEQEVNGQKVLVPVVYLSRATAERMAAEGALIDGNTLSINSTGTVRNDGTLSADKGAFLSADTLINDGTINGGAFTGITTRGDTVNRGRIEGNAIAIDAGGSVINTVRFDGMNATGGVINAGTGGLQVTAALDVINQGQMASAGHAVVTAGRDFVQNAAINTTTAAGTIKAPAGSLTTGSSAVVTAGRDVALDQSSINAGQHVVIDAERDAHFTAADVTAGGSIAVTAGRDIISDTVTDTTTMIDRQSIKEGKKKTTTTTTTTDETLRGNAFQASSDIAMVAGQDINLTATTVHSDKGDIALAAGRDVNLLSGYETDTLVQDSSSKKKNTLSTTKTKSHTEISDTTAVGTTLSSENVSISAKRDITTEGATVVATHDVAMAAGRNLTIGTAQNTYTESGSSSSKKSGIAGAGVGITIGTSKTSQDYSVEQIEHQGSLIGALEGGASLSAGEAVHITGSDVLSNTGTAITGKTVTIDAAVDTTEVAQKQKTRSAGIHIGLKGGAATAAEQAYSYGKAVGEVSDDRLKALYAVEAASNAMTAANGVNAMANGAPPSSTGMALRIGIGASSASSQMESYDETARGSNIHSNGNVLIAATDGDLNVIGSNVEGKNVALAATGNINLKSQEEQHSASSQNKNGSAEVGVSIGQTTGFYVSGSAGRGEGQRNGTTHAETMIKASDTAAFVSGGDTTLQGAQVIGDRVIGQVGGDFNIISEQDTDDFRSKQKQAGGEFVYGAGGSVSYSQQSADSHYASVKEQSGIQAGKGGFQIDVAGNTHLQGGAIAATADESQNRLSTGSLTVADIKNEASASASGKSYGADSGMMSGSKYAAAKGVVGNQIGNGDDSEHRSSVTQADISAGTVEVRNGDLTALEGLGRSVVDLSGGNGLASIDLQKLQENVGLEQELKGVVYEQAIKFTDEAYRTMFLKEAKVYVVDKDADGNLLPPRELTEEDKFNLKPSADGKVHIADNGINNVLDAANKYADQHSTTDGPQYFIHFPKAENGFSELLIAGYQKYLESDTMGLANATELTREYMLDYGQDGLHLDGHSRGSLTVGNAMESIQNLAGSAGMLGDTTIAFFGPAYNAAAADDLLSYLQNRSSWDNPQAGVLTLQNHRNDIVGGLIGLNPPTGGVTPEGGHALFEMGRVLGGKNTPHNCYGAADPACKDLWNDSRNGQSIPVPINQLPMSRAEEIMYRFEKWRGGLK